ncbi:hypothetical protein SteCoe_19114 [Stentor coeruleus]|uniref:ODAD1 central coiled coil region domain-containing protein n=1 Tax=Stentor coeruleus TaxID=5963 RepID=A0A1R2BUY7_9CILI|nr:hypothetical protein SteCoe_19114 [Stentor coeruleus]
MMFRTRRSITPGPSYRQESRQKSESFDDEYFNVNNKDNETREIAAYLNLIRKRHDKIKQENFRKKITLENLKKVYEKTLSLAQSGEENSSEIETKIQEVKNSLVTTKKQYKQETNDHNSYMYILDRMKKDRIAMEIQANNFQSSLKSTKLTLKSESNKSQKVKESNFKSKMILLNVKKTFSQSQNKKNQYIQNLIKEIKSREDAATRREDRQKRQMDIAEAAANDDQDSPEVKLREKLLLYKMWLNFLNKKLTGEMKQAIDVERAFSKIKSATGLSYANDIVEKFLTREQNYFMLLKAVNDAERKLKSLTKENRSAKEMLMSLQFEDPKEKENLKVLRVLEGKVVGGFKSYVNFKEKLNSSIKIYDQLLSWSQKIMIVMNIPNNFDLHSGSKANEAKNNLPDVFNVIHITLSQLIEIIKSNPDEVKKISKTLSQMKTNQVIEKMSTKDNLSKIIRVKMGGSDTNNDNEAK